ncbi:hypothetical protein [Hyalangium sp.]|uniref:hypothetical protein n=1 Tax=Hyalangium sp. TaxID=2028555 RepID=UPI00389B2D71
MSAEELEQVGVEQLGMGEAGGVGGARMTAIAHASKVSYGAGTEMMTATYTRRR